MKPRTMRDILVSVERLSRFHASEELENLTTGAIRSYLYHGRLELGWSARTFVLHWHYLKLYFDWCIKAGYVKENPVLSIDKPRLPQHLPRCLCQADAQKVLYSSSTALARTELLRTRREAIVSTFLMTGIRRAELLHLRTGDVDLTCGAIFVRSGKGRKDRTVPVYPRLLPVLRRYLSEKKKAGTTSEWFFSSIKSDKQLTEKNLYAILKQVELDAQVKFSPHMLRHTLGRELVEADFNVYKLKEILGHANVATTQIYVALSQKNIKESLEQADIY